MVHDPQVARLGLDRLDVAVVRNPRRHDVVAPPVPRLGRNRMRRRGHDHVGLDGPGPELLKLDHGRRVLGVAPRRTVLHPVADRRDLVVGQRLVVLEALQADLGVDVPRGHLARFDLGPDRPRPRTGLLIGHQRHGRHVVGPVAHLAGALQNRLDVLVERRVLGRLGRGQGRDHQRCCRQTAEHESGVSHSPHLHESRIAAGGRTHGSPEC